MEGDMKNANWLVVALALTLTACDSATSGMNGYGNGGGGNNNSGPPWHVTYYNTTVNTNGNPPSDATAYSNNATVTVLGNVGAPALTWSGFTFDGWNTMDNGGLDGGGGGTFYAPGSTFQITSNVTLYGQWH
jgi:hypothetical protein